MKDFNDLIEERKLKLSQIEAINDKVKVETREMFTSENENFNKILDEIKIIDTELEEKRKLTQKNNITIINKKNTMEQFSLIRSIRNVVDGRGQDDATLAMLEAGKNEFAKAGLSFRGQLALPMEYRDIKSGSAAEGAEIVGIEKFALLPYLRANSVLLNAGATLLSGLVGDVSIPVLATGATAVWKSEVDIATAANQGFAEKTMSPKRITSFYDVSKQFLMQDSVGASEMLQADLLAAANDLLEATILGTAAGSATQPAGLFYSPTLAFSGTSTFANLVAMESAVSANNALKNGAKYLIHPSSLGVLKTTQKGSGVGFIAENATINGYNYLTTTNLPALLSSKAGLFGTFSDLIIGNWGGIDLTIDPYSRAIYGQVRIVINLYVDSIIRREASFSKAAIK